MNARLEHLNVFWCASKDYCTSSRRYRDIAGFASSTGVYTHTVTHADKR